MAAIALPLLLVAPALWNGYPLLQYDTGGYLARWYEGYLVPSRSSSYGIYLHLGEPSYFWLNLLAQAFAVLWLVPALLRLFGLSRPLQIVVVVAALCLTTALPVLTSMLLTDIFAGLAVLALYQMMVHGARFSALETVLLVLFAAFAGSTHSATLGVMCALGLAGLLMKPWLGQRLPWRGLALGGLAIVISAAMLLAANLALSGRLAWTPGGTGVAFGRMLQDGLVKRYLDDHCATESYKLCPHRDALPATGDDFLWGKSVFNDLGRFNGLGDEMATITGRALLAYPGQQLAAAARATATQLVSVATGEGSHNYLAHTYGIIERYLPQQVPAVRAARQQHWEFDFSTINLIHVPVALASMLALLGILVGAAWRGTFDEIAMLAATVMLALLGNAVLCGVLSGPHDRYGARMVWLATLVVLIAAATRRTATRPRHPA